MVVVCNKEACRAEFEVCIVVDTVVRRLGRADAERAKLFGPQKFSDFNPE
jgi:hypothetical protein